MANNVDEDGLKSLLSRRKTCIRICVNILRRN